MAICNLFSAWCPSPAARSRRSNDCINRGCARTTADRRAGTAGAADLSRLSRWAWYCEVAAKAAPGPRAVDVACAAHPCPGRRPLLVAGGTSYGRACDGEARVRWRRLRYAMSRSAYIWRDLAASWCRSATRPRHPRRRTARTRRRVVTPSRGCGHPLSAHPVSKSKSLMLLAHPTRFERVTFAFGGQRSIQLSYGCMSVVVNSPTAVPGQRVRWV